MHNFPKGPNSAEGLHVSPAQSANVNPLLAELVCCYYPYLQE